VVGGKILHRAVLNRVEAKIKILTSRNLLIKGKKGSQLRKMKRALQVMPQTNSYPHSGKK